MLVKVAWQMVGNVIVGLGGVLLATLLVLAVSRQVLAGDAPTVFGDAYDKAREAAIKGAPDTGEKDIIFGEPSRRFRRHSPPVINSDQRVRMRIDGGIGKQGEDLLDDE